MKPYPQYKNSGIEWIGEVPEGWEVKKLKYASYINPTKEATLDKNSDELVTFLPMENVSESGQICCDNKKPISSLCTGFTYFKKHDVIIAKITPCFENGKGALLNNLDTEIGFGSTEFHVLRAVRSIFSAFLFYITRTYQFRTLGEAFMSGAAGQKRVPTDFIEDFPVALPSVSEQTTIAAFLDRKTAEIDSIIAKKERLIELYEEEKAAVINHAVTKGLDPAAKMKDSGIEWLGEIPEHWEVKRLKFIKSQEKNSFVDGPFGSHLKSEHFIDDGDVYVIDSGCITSGDFIQKNDFRTISMQHFETIKRSECRENDIIIAKIGANFGMSGILPKLDKLSVVSGNSLKLTVRKDYQLNLIHYQLLNLKRLGIIDIEVKGSAQPALSMQLMSDMPFLKANMKEQTAIVQHIETKCGQIDAIISKFKRQIELLKEYRTALISEAVTGKIDLRHEI